MEEHINILRYKTAKFQNKTFGGMSDVIDDNNNNNNNNNSNNNNWYYYYYYCVAIRIR